MIFLAPLHPNPPVGAKRSQLAIFFLPTLLVAALKSGKLWDDANHKTGGEKGPERGKMG